MCHLVPKHSIYISDIVSATVSWSWWGYIFFVWVDGYHLQLFCGYLLPSTVARVKSEISWAWWVSSPHLLHKNSSPTTWLDIFGSHMSDTVVTLELWIVVWVKDCKTRTQLWLSKPVPLNWDVSDVYMQIWYTGSSYAAEVWLRYLVALLRWKMSFVKFTLSHVFPTIRYWRFNSKSGLPMYELCNNGICKCQHCHAYHTHHSNYCMPHSMLCHNRHAQTELLHRWWTTRTHPQTVHAQMVGLTQ